MKRARVVVGVAAVVVAIAIFGIGWGGGAAALGQGGAPPLNMQGMSMTQGMGMMGGPFAPSARPLSTELAIQTLRQWPAARQLDGLVLDEVEAYTENFYGQFKERSTGRGAIQVLVDRYTGRAMPEMGPNMMWNAKYGHEMMQAMMGNMRGSNMMGESGMMDGMMNGIAMPGMMGGGSMQPGNQAQAPSTTQLSVEEARQRANTFLSGYLPGATVGDGDTFYGYHHFDVLRDGRQVGMLSVHAGNGSVWYHTWHGEFLEKVEIGHWVSMRDARRSLVRTWSRRQGRYEG